MGKEVKEGEMGDEKMEENIQKWGKEENERGDYRKAVEKGKWKSMGS